MDSLLYHYTKLLTSLDNRDGSRDYSLVSRSKAPHQPLLLLAVVDLYSKTPTRSNLILIDYTLSELWNIYKSLIGMPKGSSVAMPSYALRTAPFWHLIGRPGTVSVVRRIRTINQFNEFYIGVALDETLHHLLKNGRARTSIRKSIVEFYLPEETWLNIQEPSELLDSPSFAAAAYANRLSNDVSYGLDPYSAKSENSTRVFRNSGFRKTVTLAYDYRCALCGVRLRNSDGRVVVQAAHIVPWSLSHDDRPVNGLCLCPLCHWAFDARMIGVGHKLEIMTNAQIQSRDNVPGYLATLRGRTVLLPKEARYRPDKKCIRNQIELFYAARIDKSDFGEDTTETL